MKKIMVIGSTGMAGHIVTKYLEETGKYDITNVAYRNKLNESSIILDVLNEKDVSSIIEQYSPSIIINCVGVLNGSANKIPSRTIRINGAFPHSLEEIARKYEDTKVIHISTDCVFSGRETEYREDHIKDGIGYYAQSKAIGEIINDKDLTFRMSIIGPEIKDGEGLFHWFMKQTGKISGYSNVMWNGITTLELAKGIDAAIASNVTGLFHLIPSGVISKYELLKLFNNIWNKNIIIEPYADKYETKILVNTRTDFKQGSMVPDYKTMLEQQFEWMTKHPELYSQYRRI